MKIKLTIMLIILIALNCRKSNVSRVIDRPTKRCKGYKIISDIIYK